MGHIKKLITCLFILALCNGSVRSSSHGRIEGQVLGGELSYPVMNAFIMVLDTRAGSRTMMDGSFNVVEIPAGTYAVKAYERGFEPQVIDSIIISPGKTTRLQFNLAYNDSVPIFECPHGGVDICEIHNVKLMPIIMTIEYPLVCDSEFLAGSDAEIYDRARKTYFPHADIECEPDIHGEFRAITVFLCPECRVAYKDWYDEHDKIKALINSKARFR
jgi:hypothetical protein